MKRNSANIGLIATILFLLLGTAVISVQHAQEVSPETKRKINEAYTTMERYKRTTPAWKQYVDAGMAAGNYFMSVGEWSNALNAFNKVLKVTPNYYEAIAKRNYCRRQLKLAQRNKSKGSK